MRKVVRKSVEYFPIIFIVFALSFSLAADGDDFATVCYKESHSIIKHNIYCEKTNIATNTLHESFDMTFSDVDINKYKISVWQDVTRNVPYKQWFNTTDTCNVAWLPFSDRNATIEYNLPELLFCPEDNRLRTCNALYSAKGKENRKCQYEEYTDIPNELTKKEWVQIPINYTMYNNHLFSGNKLTYASGETKIFKIEYETPLEKYDNGYGSNGGWSTNPAGWWSASWRYRQEINITNNGGEAINQPVRINFSSTNVGAHWNWSNYGKDLRFTDKDNTTEYYHKTITWSGVKEEAEVWVNVTNLTGESVTAIYVYYGNFSVARTDDGNQTFPIYQSFENGTMYYTTGNNGTGISFDGSTNYIDVPDDNALDIRGNLTYGAWIKTTTTSASVLRIMSKGQDSAGAVEHETGFSLGYKGSTDELFYGKIGWCTGTSWGGGNLNDGTWHYVAGTYNTTSGNVSRYIDGTFIEQLTCTEQNTTNKDFTIGSYIASNGVISYYWDGEIERPHVYSRTLSAEDITAIYDNKHVIIDGDLEALWVFDGNTSEYARNIVTDSANSNDGYVIDEKDIDPVWEEVSGSTDTSGEEAGLEARTMEIHTGGGYREVEIVTSQPEYINFWATTRLGTGNNYYGLTGDATARTYVYTNSNGLIYYYDTSAHSSGTQISIDTFSRFEFYLNWSTHKFDLDINGSSLLSAVGMRAGNQEDGDSEFFMWIGQPDEYVDGFFTLNIWRDTSISIGVEETPPIAGLITPNVTNATVTSYGIEWAKFSWINPESEWGYVMLNFSNATYTLYYFNMSLAENVTTFNASYLQSSTFYELCLRATNGSTVGNCTLVNVTTRSAGGSSSSDNSGYVAIGIIFIALIFALFGMFHEDEIVRLLFFLMTIVVIIFGIGIFAIIQTSIQDTVMALALVVGTVLGFVVMLIILGILKVSISSVLKKK